LENVKVNIASLNERRLGVHIALEVEELARGVDGS